MFYKEDEVNERLTCSVCTHLFYDPRILPCGDSACNDCIDRLLSKSDNRFDCMFCQEKHEPPRNAGFPPNKVLLGLINAKAAPVYRNQKVDKFTEKLTELQCKCDNFKHSRHNGTDRVQVHCNTLRNQVHLRTEVMIERIHQMNESLVAEIGDYEQGCIRSYREKIAKDQTSDIAVNQFLDEVEEFRKETSKYLNEFKIDSKVINYSLEEVAVYLKELEVETVNLKAIEFDGQLLEFIPNTSDDDLSDCLLGHLEYASLKPTLKGLNIYIFSSFWALT
jgi:hypothetical protein